jgi:uncharacterized protein YcbK (DUF882 family)
LASLLIFGGARSVHDATASGDTRTLSFHHTHSDEDLTVTFKRNGRYDEDALKQINHFLRDWRSQDETTMDRHLFDILWEVYRDVDGKQPIQIISAYRSPATNAMLRHRSAHTGVARFSQHMLGHAMDFFIPNVPLEQIRFAGLRLQRGGVGFYPTSGSPFVHLDTGGIRHWPRMTHDQLARVFPDGRTVHVPSDGNPLPGYELALADIQHRDANEQAGSFANKPSLLASLFRGRQAAEEDDEAGSAANNGPAAAKTLVSMASADTSKRADAVPLPRAKPATAASYQVASAGPQVALRTSAPTVDPKPQTPADIINARGFWGDDADKPKQATPAQVAAIAARNAFASADPQPTASIQQSSQALAYAPPIDRVHVVAASAPMPRSIRPASPARNPMAAEITTIVTKGQQGHSSAIATAARIAPATNANGVWMRAMIVAPSASTDMRATSLGDQDMTLMRHLFIKPNAAVAMTFSDDPQMGITSERFSGSAMGTLTTTSFVMRTAALR